MGRNPKRLPLKVAALWDNGSTLSFITLKLAKLLRLSGKRLNLCIEVVGGNTTNVESYEYCIHVIDQSGEVVEMQVIGIEKISSDIGSFDAKEVSQLFKIDQNTISRPNGGEIDLLLGVRYAGYHPVRCDARGHLLLLQNRFGCTIEGTHPNIKEKTKIEAQCMQLRHAIVMFVSERVGHENADQFHTIEGLGVTCIPQCGSCKCGKCHPGGKDMSLKDEREYELIESKIKFNSERGRWMASYPWIRDPKELKPNKHIALKILQSTERRLSQNQEHAELYSRQIRDMINRNAARKVTKEELERYNGRKFYIVHHGILKPNSASTPLRIVFNSSAAFGGISMNDCLAKGPSLLNNLYGVLLRFRQYSCAFIGDISKMYHSIDIPVEDQMVHLFLWRDLNITKEPETYAMTVVNMGDRPSATIAQTALQKTAEQAKDEFPESSEIISRNTYMDDVTGGADSKEDALERMSEIGIILSKAGFHIKEWIHAGSKRQLCMSKDQKQVHLLMGMNNDNGEITEGVLGMKWNVERDTIQFSINWEKFEGRKSTKRHILSVINSIYDPLGILTPFIIRAKILIRKMWAQQQPKLGWDDDLPNNIETEWKGIVKDMSKLNNLEFQRSVMPEDAIENPMLVVFADGSGDAYGAAAYIRWKLLNGGYSAQLLTSKSRMAPLKLIDTVRLELSGSTLGTRLRASILKEIGLIFHKIIHLVDSEIVHAMIHRESYGFNTFVGNRIGEIQRNTVPDEWGWIEGKLNIADLTTRGCSPDVLATGSTWQNGPEFLTLPEEHWPVRWKVKSGIQITELRRSAFTGKVMPTVEEGKSLAGLINQNNFSKWKTLQYTTARILKLYKRFRKEGSRDPELKPEDLKEAEHFWLKEAQKGMDLKKYLKLRPKEENGIIVVGGRTERWMSYMWNKQKFVLLPKQNHIALLIARHEHCKGGHLGEENTIAKIRSKYWIIDIRKMVKKMIKNCVHCKIKLKAIIQQVMSPLPVERLKPCPAFTNVGVDYFGPFEAKGEVQQRTTGKCYGVLFVCLASGAVHIDLANDYSTDGFLLVLRHFTSFRGWPSKFFSDQGTNLVGASNVLKKLVADLDWLSIKAYGHEKGTEWKFSPADAKWYNGVAEALVKSTKRALSAALGNTENHWKLKFTEMLTVMYEAGQLVNQRPIGHHPSNPDERYLCPNDLLLGRASPEVPQGPFEKVTSMKSRFRFVQQVTNTFWRRWIREVFPNLVLQKKWHTETRNLVEGDVVFLQDINAVRGKWKKALIKSAVPSQDGKVRRVVVAYRSESGTYTEVERAVQKLILLVPVDE